ncbi:hypothetical protein [Mycoplasma todarodis]|uniref:Uncharacterized protein n=1 Tax=Mycoplasma todarodis TaxID=1937191 RepID=A0A4R0XRY3_9MOLU|nr:hypothetical protein [Mycoplasma todarodis]TCG10437.1 hypothetical protein C4B25_04270 [Mycoplasma todarodis]
MIFVILAIIFGLGWFAAWITVWVKGTQSQNNVMVILGGLFTLGFIGLVIALIQTSGWNNNNVNAELYAQKLELERQRKELEEQKKSQDKE